MFSLDDLAAIIDRRSQADSGHSYTRSLIDKGVVHCAKKLGEEATEAVIAAVAQDDLALKAEAADLLYHLLVVLKARGVPLVDVMGELDRRTSRSGLEEKASRTS